MANMTFGVNIIPKDNTVSIGNSEHPWNINSPNLTGVPIAPTATAGSATLQVATCEFVANELANFSGLPEVTSADNGKSLDVVNGEWAVGTEKIDKKYVDDNWVTKSWIGLTDFKGEYVWTDGDNVYYSASSSQYVLDKSTSTWSTKTWTGLTSFYSQYIWTDGNNIYYSASSSQYVLDKSTSTWNTKSWTGLTSFSGGNIWTDGNNIYYSYGPNQYVLNKSTSTWSTKTWTGIKNINGYYVWTDGDNVYYSDSSRQYVLADKSTSTWSTKTWTGLVDFDGYKIWTDGNNIYYSSGSDQYVLDKSTSTWSTKTWTGITNIWGQNIWTNGENINYSDDLTQYKYNKPENKFLLGSNGEFSPAPLSSITPSVMTGADGTNAGTSGLVPAPEAGDEEKFLKGDGTWAEVDSSSSGTITVEGTITNVSGPYSGTFNDARITSGMKCLELELGTPVIFDGDISVTSGNGTVTISCPEVAGTSTFTASFIASILSSTEYTALDNAKLTNPTIPVSDGTYTLKCIVSSGVATYQWASLPSANGVSF